MDYSKIISDLRAAGAPDELLTAVADLATGAVSDETSLTASVVAEIDRLEAAPRDNTTVTAMESLADVTEALQQHQEQRRSAVLGRMPVTRPALPSLGAASRTLPVSRRSAPSASRSEGAATVAVMTASGRPITGPSDLARHTAEQLRRAKPGAQVLISSASWSYPEDRRLGADPFENAAIVAAALGEQSLVASGGVCGPVNVDYTLLVDSSEARPLRDALPGFTADRGGLRFMQPPTFSGVGNSATGIWTEPTDANPGAATKPVQTVVCGAEDEVFVDAIPTRLKFGNMQARFMPEMVEANTTLALSNAARVADLNVLSKISGFSTAISTGQLLGASRDILATVDQAASAYRYRSRLDRTVKLRALLPSWALDLFRADMAREAAHGGDTADAMAITDAQIEAWFTVRGVTVTWLADGQPAQAGGAGAVASVFQGFGPQAAGAVLLGWPSELVWWLFAEGSFQFLDGAQLDLSVVRDSLLDSTNDYETFVEVFEGVAFRGYESLQIVSQVRPNGASSAPIAVAQPSIY